jgi:DNA-dependent metalloprotease WSS1
MPKPNNRIRTLADFSVRDDDSNRIPGMRGSDPSAGLPITNTAKPTNPSLSVSVPFYHIPNLADEKLAKDLLQRIVTEFYPIIQRRQYRVVSISEMCCCSDGLDFQLTPNGKPRRKLRKLSNNIWGYNRSSFWTSGHVRSSSHTIHIRLRHPTRHTRLLSYEDVAGTLAHELAHCEYSPHNKDFFKLMDDILEEHATLLASKLRYEGNPMMPFSGSGQVSGSSASSWSSLGPGYRLKGSATHNGGATGSSGRSCAGKVLGGDSTFTQWMTPSEAAAVAAEARRRQQQLRLRGDDCCHPCTTMDDNESDDSESSVDKNSVVTAKQPPGSVKAETNNAKGILTRSSSENVVYIDLTNDDTDEYCSAASNAIEGNGTGGQVPKRRRRLIGMQEWNCRQCTFLNTSVATMCDMCASERFREVF